MVIVYVFVVSNFEDLQDLCVGNPRGIPKCVGPFVVEIGVESHSLTHGVVFVHGI